MRAALMTAQVTGDCACAVFQPEFHRFAVQPVGLNPAAGGFDVHPPGRVATVRKRYVVVVGGFALGCVVPALNEFGELVCDGLHQERLRTSQTRDSTRRSANCFGSFTGAGAGTGFGVLCPQPQFFAWIERIPWGPSMKSTSSSERIGWLVSMRTKL